MSKEDDAIIQAVADEITNNLGPDTWEGSGLEGYSAAGRAEMMDVAKAAIAAYLGSLEAAGWAVVRKRADDAITHNTFPKQGSFLGRRVLVAFDYDTANAVLGTVRREDVEAPGRMIIELDDGRLVLSTECQYSLVKESGTRQ